MSSHRRQDQVPADRWAALGRRLLVDEEDSVIVKVQQGKKQRLFNVQVGA